MKTVRIYMVRKPSDIDEIMILCQRHADKTEKVLITETINLTQEQYNTICQAPLNNYNFLSGKGGYDNENHRHVVELKCTDLPTLFVDPSGSSYCRYMGIKL